MRLQERIDATKMVNEGVALTMKELQAYWQCSRSTIWRAMKRNDEPLIGTRINGMLRFSADEIKRHAYDI